jgi:hypothetical protein
MLSTRAQRPHAPSARIGRSLLGCGDARCPCSACLPWPSSAGCVVAAAAQGSSANCGDDPCRGRAAGKAAPVANGRGAAKPAPAPAQRKAALDKRDDEFLAEVQMSAEFEVRAWAGSAVGGWLVAASARLAHCQDSA